ncbi:MAG: aminoglycoside phosphotransferase family protein [Pseudomonadota bacterium]
MLVKPPLADQRIIDCLSNDYGMQIVTLNFLPLGADTNAWVFKAEANNEVAYFVKLKRGHHHAISVVIVELLQNAGIKQIIPPSKNLHNQSTQQIGDFTLIVYPFIDGLDGFNRNLSDEQWRILGKTLRQVHDCEVPAVIQQELRRETFSAKWREVVRSLYTHIETNPQGDVNALRLMEIMKEQRVAILRLVNQAEQLAKKLQNETQKFVLCHSDIHAGNVLIAEENAIYLVDWDDPIMAPKERDLMFIGGGVANVWNRKREEGEFYQGYGAADVNLSLLAYYRCERIVEDIALYGQDLLLTTTGDADRAQMVKHFVAMFEPNGVVEIAFNTAQNLA